MQNSSTAVVVKVILFWASFWLILFGLNHLPVGGDIVVAKTIAAGIAVLLVLMIALGFLRIEGADRLSIGLEVSPNRLPQFLLGAGMGILLVACMILALLLLTPLEIATVGNSDILAFLATSFLVIFLLALMEEIAFRSYSLFRLQQIWGIRPAIYVTAIAFGLYHGISFDNLLGQGVWGLLFAWMAISTNSIALPTGFHFGANWLQALVGMKPQYGGSIWEVSIGSGGGLLEIESLGVAMQVILLIVGVVLIERLIRKNGG